MNDSSTPAQHHRVPPPPHEAMIIAVVVVILVIIIYIGCKYLDLEGNYVSLKQLYAFETLMCV
jgi:hypothetical protein